MRPPFLSYRDEEDFAAIQAEFDCLLPSGLVDVLGNSVIFGRDRCHHVCYKPEDRRWNKGPRDQWRPDRAERIPWIREALMNPNYIRVSTGLLWVYLLEVKEDRANNLGPELFATIVNSNGVQPAIPGTVHFITGYTISYQEWNEFKRNRPWIYPSEVPKPAKSKKK